MADGIEEWIGPNCEDGDWTNYDYKHRSSKSAYEESNASRKSEYPGHAQYNPFEFPNDEAIKEVECRCVREGIEISKGTNCHNRQFYLKLDVDVGYCNGKTTKFIFVELTNRTYHGWPISEKSLQLKIKKFEKYRKTQDRKNENN